MAQVRGAEAGYTTTAVAVVTTAETIAITSPSLAPQSPAQRFVVLAWAQLTVGTGTTGITPRLYRGASLSGTLLGVATLEAVLGAVGSTEPHLLMLVDQPGNIDEVVYTFSLQQAAATANGSIVQASIMVLAL